MGFAELFTEDTVICGLRSASRDDCFQEMLGKLVEAKRLTAAESELALDAIRKREKVGTTGIGSGVAIPHVKLEGVKRIAAALAIHRDGVDFQAIDGAPVRVVFLVVRPAADDGEHLKFLQWVSRIGRNADFRRFIANATTPAEMLGLLHEMSGI
jgi:mannitol/fructose-specific phosphotransferase system IIA component (Ntr-type)